MFSDASSIDTPDESIFPQAAPNLSLLPIDYPSWNSDQQKCYTQAHQYLYSLFPYLEIGRIYPVFTEVFSLLAGYIRNQNNLANDLPIRCLHNGLYGLTNGDNFVALPRLENSEQYKIADFINPQTRQEYFYIQHFSPGNQLINHILCFAKDPSGCWELAPNFLGADLKSTVESGTLRLTKYLTIVPEAQIPALSPSELPYRKEQLNNQMDELAYLFLAYPELHHVIATIQSIIENYGAFTIADLYSIDPSLPAPLPAMHIFSIDDEASGKDTANFRIILTKAQDSNEYHCIMVFILKAKQYDKTGEKPPIAKHIIRGFAVTGTASSHLTNPQAYFADDVVLTPPRTITNLTYNSELMGFLRKVAARKISNTDLIRRFWDLIHYPQ